MTLYELPLNKIGIVNSLNCNGNIRRRLLDLGLVPNTEITPIPLPSGAVIDILLNSQFSIKPLDLEINYVPSR